MGRQRLAEGPVKGREDSLVLEAMDCNNSAEEMGMK